MVFINRLQPADGKRDALIGLLREFADSINADPEAVTDPGTVQAGSRRTSASAPRALLTDAAVRLIGQERA